MRLVILGKDLCLGCQELKQVLLMNNVKFEYITDIEIINKYRKDINFHFFHTVLSLMRIMI